MAIPKAHTGAELAELVFRVTEFTERTMRALGLVDQMEGQMTGAGIPWRAFRCYDKLHNIVVWVQQNKTVSDA